MLDGSESSLFFPGDAKLTEAVEALVGFHFDKSVVALTVVDGIGFDVGNFHDGSLKDAE
jgi:hypothetical protein